jgi:putative SOS response-associated peptidase YedK
MPGIDGRFPDFPAPVIRESEGSRELTMMRWGMTPSPRTGGPPVTNIRNTSSPHWRIWLKPENRGLVPARRVTDFEGKNALRAIEAERGFAKGQADTQTATRITLAPPHEPSAAR